MANFPHLDPLIVHYKHKKIETIKIHFKHFCQKINIKTLRLPILFVRSMTSSFLIRSWNQRLWRLLHNHCKTFGSSLPPKAKRYPNMLKVAKKKQYTLGKIIERAFSSLSVFNTKRTLYKEFDFKILIRLHNTTWSFVSDIWVALAFCLSCKKCHVALGS